ncbi:MAG: efflux RND transporter permease subunit, partial [Phycisphaerales bacterium]
MIPGISAAGTNTATSDSVVATIGPATSFIASDVAFTGPIVATTLSQLAVYVPAALMPGLTGQLYNQFAMTIAVSVGL